MCASSFVEVEICVRAIPRAGVGNNGLFTRCGNGLAEKGLGEEDEKESFHEENLPTIDPKSIVEEVTQIDAFILDGFTIVAGRIGRCWEGVDGFGDEIDFTICESSVEILAKLSDDLSPPFIVGKEGFLIGFLLGEIEERVKVGRENGFTRAPSGGAIYDEAILEVGMVAYEERENFPPLVGGELVAFGHFLETLAGFAFDLSSNDLKGKIGDRNFIACWVHFLDFALRE
ncbi:MAG: hypothetical protein ACJA16_003858 [Akkermansiaceae bacterium]